MRVEQQPRPDVYGLESPNWPEREPLTVDGCRAAFAHDVRFTIGVEEELMLVDRERYELAPHVPELLPTLGDRRLATEIRSAQLEVVTPVCRTAADACREVADAKRHLFDGVGDRYAVLAAGTHPTSTRWGDVTEAERYREIADEYLWAATRSMVCGLHVHVALGDAGEALAVFNAMRSYLPELAALGTNAPFFEGVDTGMCSIRPKLNEFYPRSGVPPAFAEWDDLVSFVDWGRRGHLFPDASHLWWDLRPHPGYGTIELRAVDAQTRAEDTAAIVALVQALAAWLAERIAAGEPPRVHETHRITENAWRANRYGVRGWLLDLDTGTAEPTRDRLARLLDELEPYAERFDSGQQLDGARPLLAGNGADRQRYVAGSEGLDAVAGWLARETEESALDG